MRAGAHRASSVDLNNSFGPLVRHSRGGLGFRYPTGRQGGNGGQEGINDKLRRVVHGASPGGHGNVILAGS